jgi:hypothetical protein
VAVTFAAPLSAQDADGDLLDDAIEIQLGTDPAIADSDDDGLTDGYEAGAGRYELRSLVDSTWDAARLDAVAAGGALAVWGSQDEFDAFALVAESFPRTGFMWVGTSYVGESWKWLGGTPADAWVFSGEEYTDTDDGEVFAYSDNRENSDGSFRFGLFSGGGPSSTGSAGYILEIGDYTGPLDPDSDDDGLDDGDEVSVHGTDPNQADTDGDGYFDKTEIDSGGNPLDDESTPPLLTELKQAVRISFVSKLGERYQIESSEDEENWSFASDEIEGTGGEVSWFTLAEDEPRRFFRVAVVTAP